MKEPANIDTNKEGLVEELSGTPGERVFVILDFKRNHNGFNQRPILALKR